MSYKFTSIPGTVRKFSGGDFWEVRNQFFWLVNYDDKKDRIVIPRGFKTDFGSIPHILHLILNPTKWNAFVLHDWAYQNCWRTRFESDRVLLNALIVEGASVFEAWLIYRGVRIGGWYAWNQYKKLLLTTKK